MDMGFVAICVILLLLVIVVVLLMNLLKSQRRSEDMQLFAQKQEFLGEQFKTYMSESREAATASRKELNEQIDTLQKELREQADAQQKELREQVDAQQKELREQVESLQKELRETLQKSEKEQREQMMRQQAENREAQSQVFAMMNKSQKESFEQIEKSQRESLTQLEKSQKESLERLDKTQNQLIKSTDERLENIRVTVAEKLDKTLTERLGKSFETVGKQLNEVQQGLGEMKNLAQDVGGLKKVLSNVKMRGGLGEIQLQMLLENILAPDQYCANVITKKASREVVEFAVKLPGNSDDIPNIWLPIDAKFPKDVYEKLQNAYDLADPAAVEAAQKELDAAIKLNAKDISGKYVDPPYTTNFAIMFLPFEGIYAEVVRKAELLEYIQRQYNVIITGPTTLAAILNSLQIGFKTLAIQKRSSEVWETLGAVKTEFDNFGGLLDKAKNKIQGGLNDMDTLIGTRTRAIQRKLRSVESLDQEQSQKLLEMD